MGNIRRLVLGVSAAAFFALAGSAIAGESPTPASGATREDPLRELGRRLFFDPAASRMGMRSCADCHEPGHGYSDPEKVSRDDASATKRHSQTIVDTADSPTGHWDGEFHRIEEVVRSRMNLTIAPDGSTQYGSAGGSMPSIRLRRLPHIDAKQRPDEGFAAAVAAAAKLPAADDAPAAFVGLDLLPKSPAAAGAFSTPAGTTSPLLEGFVEPRGADARPGVETTLAASRRYAEAFCTVFGDEKVTIDRISLAVERYCHSVRSGESAYDRFAAGEDGALSASAKRGLDLFRGAAGCASCHAMDGSRARFTDYLFHDTGVSWKALAPSARRANAGDVGAMAHGGHGIRTFKTPTLRDVARRGPFMHDGSLATLEDVVRHYVGSSNAAAGPSPRDPALDAKFPAYDASDADVADLVAFLKSLTSDRRPGLAASAWAKRAKETRLEFHDAKGRPLAGLAVEIVPAGDVLPGFAKADASARTMTTGADGSITFEPLRSTHARVRLPDGVRPVGGDLVPDTCAAAVVVVPVDGRASLVVTFPKGTSAPETLLASHPESPLLPERRTPTSMLRRRSVETAADGTQQGTYETAYRTDVGSVAEIALAKPAWGLKSLRLFLDPAVPALLTLP
jgi:cytochrome c peroxidase